MPRTSYLFTGFSLVEAMISMSVVGIMLVAAINTLGGAAKARNINTTLQHGPALASDLMAEILQHSFEEPIDTPASGLETGENTGTRANFDDVDDFDGWHPGAIQSTDGTAIDHLTGWTRQVSVVRVQDTDLDTPSATGTLKKITVTVTSPQGKSYRLVGLRSQHGAYEQLPDSATTILSKVGVKIQVGSDPGSTVNSSSSILNRTVAPASLTE